MANKAIFLDRDNTLIEDPGYINNPDQVKLIDGVPEALIEFKAMGYKLVVVSNQSAVARGLVTEEVLDKIHKKLKKLLTQNKASLDKIYYCPYHVDGVIKKYSKESDWRKPNHGMLIAASNDMDIDLTRSWMIGNSDSDIEAGLKAGCITILLDKPSHDKLSEPSHVKPHYKAVNMKEAVNIVKKHLRSNGQSQVDKTQSADNASLQTIQSNQNTTSGTTEQLLVDILEQLRRNQRSELFQEFSIMRLMAGIIQVTVLFCLLISIWFLMSPTRQSDAVLISIGFAAVLQVMALTFYIMQRQE